MAEFSESASVSAIAVTAAVASVILLLVLLCSVGKRDKKDDKDDCKEENEEQNKSDSRTDTSKQTSKKSKQSQRGKKSQVNFSHRWLAGTLKGNSSQVLGMDFSPNGKYLITTAEDRTVMMWSTKEFSQKEHKFIRGNIELDHGCKVKFTPDSKAFIVILSNANTVRICRIGKKDDGTPGNITTGFDFPQKHQAEISHIGIASNGKFIMTSGRDTTVIIWSIKGEVLSNLDTHQMNNSYAAVSPCGRFVGSSGFTPDVKVWEVCFDKGGIYQETRRAFELKGHHAGVYSFCFNSDSSRMASASKDGTWKYWDTNVRYEMQQDPYLLRTGDIKLSGPTLISLSPDGRTVAVGGDNSITFFNALSGDEEDTIDGLYSGGIVEMAFDLSNKYLVTAGDRHIHVFHNVTGYRATIVDLKDKEKKANTQAIKERVRQQISDAKNSLETILGHSNGHANSSQ